MEQLELNGVELKEFLIHIIENNRVIQKEGLNPISTEVVGESGLGKTSIVMQLAKSLDLNFVKLNLAQIEELGDLVGYPIREYLMEKQPTKTVLKKNAQGQTKKVVERTGEPVKKCWVNEKAIEQYSKKGYQFTNESRMTYAPPEWIAGKEGGGILVLDDWNRAD